MSCPSRKELLLNLINVDEGSDVELHVDACADCQIQSAELLKLLLEANGDDTFSNDEIPEISDERAEVILEGIKSGIERVEKEAFRKRRQKIWVSVSIAASLLAGLLGIWISKSAFRNSVSGSAWEEIQAFEVRHRQLSALDGVKRDVDLEVGVYHPNAPFEIVIPNEARGFVSVLRIDNRTTTVFPSKGNGIDLETSERDEEGRAIIGPFEPFEADGYMFIFIATKPTSAILRANSVDPTSSDIEEQGFEILKSVLNESGVHQGLYLKLRFRAKPQKGSLEVAEVSETLRNVVERSFANVEQDLLSEDRLVDHQRFGELLNHLGLMAVSKNGELKQWLGRMRNIREALELKGDFDGALQILNVCIGALADTEDQIEVALEIQRLRSLAKSSRDIKEHWQNILNDWSDVQRQSASTEIPKRINIISKAVKTMDDIESIVGTQSYYYIDRIRILLLLLLEAEEFELAEKFALKQADLVGKVYGIDSRLAAIANQSLVQVYEKWRQLEESRFDFAASLVITENELSLLEKVLGDDHWQTRSLQFAKRRAITLSSSQERLNVYREAIQLWDDLDERKSKRSIEIDEEISTLRSIVAKLSNAVAPDDVDFIDALYELSDLYSLSQDHSLDALATMDQVAENLNATRGPSFTRYLIKRSNVLLRIGDYRGTMLYAQKAYSHSMEFLKSPSLSKEPLLQYGRACSLLGIQLTDAGRFTEAKSVLRGAQVSLMPFRKAKDLDDAYEATLHNLAYVAFRSGEREDAVRLLAETTELTRLREGTDSLAYARSLAALGSANTDVTNYVKAETQLKEAISIILNYLPGEESIYYSITAELIRIYKLTGQLDKLNGIVSETMQKHPASRSTYGLGAFYHSAGACTDDITKAIEYLELGGTILRNLRGEYTLSYAQNRCELALRRKSPRDRELFLSSIEDVRTNLDRSSEGQSEEAQISLASEYRKLLGGALSTPGLELSDSELYDHLASWKGMAFKRGRIERLDSNKCPAQAREIIQQLRQIDIELVKLFQSHSASSENMKSLIQRRSDLMATLSKTVPEIWEQLAEQRSSAEAICDALPEDIALVDFFEYESSFTTNINPQQSERKLVAFVLKKGRTIQKVNLGTVHSVTKAVQDWNEAIQDAASINDSDFVLKGELVKRLIWQPLEPHLEGFSRVKISTDGVVSFVPFCALPTGRNSLVLLNELEISLVPVPQLLPTSYRESSSSNVSEKADCLCVANVDFDHYLDRSTSFLSTQSETRTRFDYLSGGEGAAKRIFQLFQSGFPKGSVHLLQASQATCLEFKLQSAGKDYIHLEVHGNLTGSASSQKGLAFAGANIGGSLEDADDGILSSREAAKLELNDCRLVVIAACESHLGDTSPGEGVLGLQRSFQLAGAECVLASLWKVDTLVTRSITERFYRNLFEKGLSPSESLLEAQRAALQEDLSISGEVKAPKYWAAWLLSGPIASK